MRQLILPLMLAGILAATPAVADWSLDPARSHLAFVTIKAKDKAEVNTFDEIQGTIDDQGRASVTLMLDSVDTLVPIRNERMRQFLFETTDYKEAVLEAKLDPEVVTGMEVGVIERITAEGRLHLHGQTQSMTLTMQAVKLDPGTVMVASLQPLVVDASKFGLSEGVEKLREVAGLDSISEAVPVTFVMTFVSRSAAD
ncbi:YceI family protein [Imhoffiella purpurea]|uniref:Lipid/polyisoprenoid-binding YceI-like domain-containing protein n=1 Tax=Imhoffiella purpurea TaxID=1249627 RepID=W9VXY4_9GAMM|nr:YceI family protein [Imhoffiella purpurea]EXJ15270.1 hypothetical protein D779_1568 [Imhoffiella purpurea]